MRHLPHLHILFLLAILTGCTARNDRQASPIFMDKDATMCSPEVMKHVDDLVMDHVAENPERAIQVIDSLRSEGLPGYEADWLLARVYSTTLEGGRPDSTIVICERLMTLPVAKENQKYRFDVLVTLVNASRLQHDDERIVKWTTELVALCRASGEETDAMRNEAEMALALSHVGRQAEAFAKNDSVMAVLDSVRQFNELDAWVIAAKRRVTMLSECDNQAAIIPASRRIIERLTDYERHPDDFHDGSYREPSDDNRQGYIDFYRAQAYGYIAEAYARSSALDSARHYLDLYEQSAYGQTLAGREMIAPTWALLGETGKMAAIYEDLATARFRSYQQRTEIERQRADAAHTQQVALVLGIVAGLLLMLVGILLSYQRIIRRKNRVLAREIAESVEYKEKYRKTLSQKTLPLPLPEGREVGTPANEAAEALSGKSIYTPTSSEGQGEGLLGDGSDAQLFRFLREAILRDELFLNPLFDRQQLMDTYHLSKDRIGAAFKQGSEFESLIDFLNDCRLDYSAKLLSTRPDMTIGEVSAASGFASVNTFGRNFKRKFTLTPSQYREQRQEMG